MRSRTWTTSVLLSLCFSAAGQNVDIEALSGLQFNFGNPGARSLGMGGAFIGLADDASAAETNPAGLTILRTREISIETRNYEEEQLFTTTGVFPDLERTAFTHYSDRVVITFASAVVPWRKFTFGAYFHEPLNNAGGGLVADTQDPLTGDITLVPRAYLPYENGVIVGAPITLQQCLQRVNEMNNPFACQMVTPLPFVSAISVRQRTFGVAAAWQVHPRFSAGLTLRQQRFKEGAFASRFTENQVAVQATARIKDDRVEIVEESDITFALGLHWKPHDRVSIGGVYKKGAAFTAPYFFSGSSTGFQLVEVGRPSFHMPDIAGIGISVRPMSVLTVNVDAVGVKYSNLVDDVVTATRAVRDLQEPYRANDVIELHVGAEYFFSTKVPFALRAGFWRDPAHSVEWNGPLTDPEFVVAAMNFPKGQTMNHFSIGGGLAFSRFQLDVAYDTSDHYKVGSVSMVTRF